MYVVTIDIPQRYKEISYHLVVTIANLEFTVSRHNQIIPKYAVSLQQGILKIYFHYSVLYKNFLAHELKILLLLIDRSITRDSKQCILPYSRSNSLYGPPYNCIIIDHPLHYSLSLLRFINFHTRQLYK